MARAHGALPDCGVLGAKLLYHDESLQHDGMVFERFPFWNGLYGNNHPGKGLPNRSEIGAPPREVEAVTGACLGISRSLYAKLGGLCEEFVFGDFEDSELCLRVRDAGKRVYYAPGVELYHLERQSQSLLPDGQSWRWQLTVYNAWLQDKRWREQINELKRAAIPRSACADEQAEIGSPMRILIVSHAHPKRVAGGAQLVAYQLHTELSRHPSVESHFLAHAPAGKTRLATFSSQERNGHEILFHGGALHPLLFPRKTPGSCGTISESCSIASRPRSSIFSTMPQSVST